MCPDSRSCRRFSKYYRAISQQIFALTRSVTPLVEPLSLDEAYLDVTENATERAARRQHRDAAESANQAGHGLTASAASRQQVSSLIASAWRKPDGETVIAPERVEAFLRSCRSTRCGVLDRSRPGATMASPGSWTCAAPTSVLRARSAACPTGC